MLACGLLYEYESGYGFLGSFFDLLVLVNGPVDWKTERLLGDRLYDLELETGKLLSLQVISRENWDSPLYKAMPFRQNVEREGITI